MTILLILLTGFAPECSNAPMLEYGPEPDMCAYHSGVPVLTYHQVSSTPSKYGVTPGKLRNDLERLYDAGFFLIQPEDIDNGLARVPWDRRPVMITFDDGWEDNFRFLDRPDGQRILDPGCAVAIVNDFIGEYPDFGQGVVFFISWDKVPFGSETEEKLNQVLDMGHAIGNHTSEHVSFMSIPVSTYDTQIIPALDSFNRRLGLRTVTVNTLAYPGGKLPAAAGAENLLAAMEYEGRPAVVQGYLVDGAVENLSRVYGNNGQGEFRISRIDMALYSVPRLLGWQNLMASSLERPSLHDELPWRP